MPSAKYPRAYVPREIDPGDFAQLEPFYRELIDRPIESSAEMEKWLRDFSELTSVVDEYGTRRYIDKSRHTDDSKIEQAFLHFVEHVEPKVKPLNFRLRQKYLASPHRDESDRRTFVLSRQWQADVELFREKNVPLQTEVTKQVNEYDKICGGMTVPFRGEEYTPQQMAKFLEDPDRATRQAAWEATSNRRMREQERIDAIFQRLLDLRHRIAQNAGLSDYCAYAWRAYNRFDYTPDDSLRFCEAIGEAVVPLVKELDREQAQGLGIPKLRPWDVAVDPQQRPPLRPFDPQQTDRFVDQVKSIVQRVSPPLAEQFESLRRNGNLDLGSRKGKQPGAYQSSLEEVRQPFVFMNAAGVQRDVETLLHEGGHAFNFLAARDEPLVFLRSPPLEFAEVASMSMEAFGSEHYDLIYDEADAARAKRRYLENVLRFFPWMATLDAFQHWLYTHPDHAAEERTAEWTRLFFRFGGRVDWAASEVACDVDWSGYEAEAASFWQRQLHLFHVPFYYVEYGIAQLGALQLWLKAREDPHRAVAGYRAALKLGGTRPLPELFAAAGIRFDFSKQTLLPLVDALQEELASLPT